MESYQSSAAAAQDNDELAAQEQKFTLHIGRSNAAVSSIRLAIEEVKKAITAHKRDVAKENRKGNKEAEKAQAKRARDAEPVAVGRAGGRGAGAGGKGRGGRGAARVAPSAVASIFAAGEAFLKR